MESKLSLITKRIRSLRKKHTRILRIEESVSEGKTLNKDQQQLLHSKPSVLARIDLLQKLALEIQSQLPKKQEIRSTTNDKERYLCIYDGFSMYYMDLNQNQDHSNLTWLPKLSTLNLPEKGLPILAGLFKLGSNAYIIGGRKFSSFEEDHSHPHDWFVDIFNSFSHNNGLQGTSCASYRLSLDHATLSLCQCDYIKPLKRPICWPIVEKIGNELHVIASFPTHLFDYNNADMVYHVALDVNNPSGDWEEIQHMMFEEMSNNYAARMWAHLVVGDRIYTKAECPSDRRILVFDAKEHEWDEEQEWDGRKIKCKSSLVIEHVADIFKFGRGRCVGGFLNGEFRNLLYVVFAIVVNRGTVQAVMYLVTFDGHVLCSQRVHDFFGGFVRPESMIESIVIDVDVDMEEEEETMCAIVRGKASNKAKSECLFVYTFSVEEVSDARLWVGDVWRRVAEKTGSSERWSCEKDFARVVVKRRYVYKLDDAHAECDGVAITRLQACFL